MNQSTSMKRFVNQFLVAAFLALPIPVVLGQTSVDDPKDGKKVVSPPVIQSWCETPAPLEIRIGIPGWLSGISGDTGVKGIVSSVDIPFHEILDDLTHVPLSLSADIRYKRWEFFGDGQYIEVGDSVTLPGLLFTDANIHLKVGGLGAAVGYRLVNCTNAWLSLFAGIRYTHLEGDLSIVDNGDARLVILRRLLGIPKRLDFSDSIGWVDPVIGARGKIKIWKATSLYAEGDVGGFDANSGSAYDIHRQGRTLVRTSKDSSDWSYQIQGGLEFQLSRWFWTDVGWRYLKYDFAQQGFTNKLAVSGPFIQSGVNF
jgi:opacity protein-like surface antigen